MTTLQTAIAETRQILVNKKHFWHSEQQILGNVHSNTPWYWRCDGAGIIKNDFGQYNPKKYKNFAMNSFNLSNSLAYTYDMSVYLV